MKTLSKVILLNYFNKAVFRLINKRPQESCEIRGNIFLGQYWRFICIMTSAGVMIDSVNGFRLFKKIVMFIICL